MIQNQKNGESFLNFKMMVANFPLKSKMYLNMLMSVDDNNNNLQVPKEIKKKYQSFLNVFRNLSADQRKLFINKSISFVQARMKNVDSHYEPDIKEIQTSCEIKTRFLAVSYWEKKNFKYEYNSLTVKLSGNKKIETINLKSYLARKSKSQHRSLILESYDGKSSERLQKITIKFSNNILFEAIFNNIFLTVLEISNKRIESLLKEEQENISGRFGQKSLENGITFLNHKTINEYFDKKQKYLLKLQQYREKVFCIHTEQAFKIFNSSKKSRYYYLQYPFPQEKVKQQPNRLQNYLKMPVIKNTQLLQSFTDNISSNYYKCTIDNTEYEFIMLVQRIEKEDSYQQIMKSINHIFQMINIEFVNITIKAINKVQYRLNIQVKMKFSPKMSENKSRFVIKLLENMVNRIDFERFALSSAKQPFKLLNKGQLNKTGISQSGKDRSKYESFSQERPMSRKRFQEQIMNYSAVKKTKEVSIEENESFSSNEQREEVFYSIQDVEDDISNEIHIFSNPVQHHENNQRKISKNNLSVYNHEIEEQKEKSSTQSYLKHVYIQKSLQNYEVKLLQKHYLNVDWRKSQNGGVICIDEKAIAEQKKVFKHFFNQLLKLQNPMYMSLPIQICRQESVLITIARNLTYAPFLFDNWEDFSPIERIKNVAIFQISMAYMALSTKKPLNPVLGQTYQGLINGCPVYLQQTSHHPPISTLYFVGRGYKIYGNVAMEVKLRLNYVKGVNNAILTIEFDSGQKIQFSLPEMVINGMIFGQRSIYYEGRNLIIDHRNRLIAETVFFSQEKLKLNGKAASPDYLTGSIFSVQDKVFEKVMKQKIKKLPKADQMMKINEYYGQWNGQFYFNQEKIFDFDQNFPHQLEDYECPLESDSIYRQDALQLKKGNMNAAQDEKIKLEQMQRADKKLRKSSAKPIKKIS